MSHRDGAVSHRVKALSLEMAPPAGAGRTFSVRRRVRLGDAAPDGALRLDSVARYLQDIANDDARDVGAAGRDLHGWVVRRTVIDLHAVPRYLQELSVTTWVAGLGAGWVDRRTRISADDGIGVEASALWVHVNPRTLRPQRLPESVLRLWDGSTNGRRVRGSMVLAPAAGAPRGDGDIRPWPVRRSDFDGFGHMNNAAYWEMVEEFRAERASITEAGSGERCIIEHLDGILPGESVSIAVSREGVDTLMTVSAGGAVKAMCFVGPLTAPAG